MEEIKNTPLENFDWDAYENGTVETAAQKEDQEKSHDSSDHHGGIREEVYEA